MSLSKLVSGVGHDLEESQNQRDARVEQLWINLDPDRTGELDLQGLQKGLRRIDHPMKNADDMLKRIMDEVDTNGDGKIQYEEFRIFVEQAERQLFILFKSIDRDGNGKLDKNELTSAFRGAGLSVSNRRLSEFFDDMDHNNDGYVSFDEWSVTPEGDSIVSEETLEGLGTDDSRSLLNTLFGSLLRVAFPFDYSKGPSIPTSTPPEKTLPPIAADRPILDEAPENTDKMDAITSTAYSAAEAPTTVTQQQQQQQQQRQTVAGAIKRHVGVGTPGQITAGITGKQQKKFRLTDFVPDPGYFLAGAIAGGVSRTATAPLDRLKVYLLVNTHNRHETAATALKQGRPVAAMKNAARPFGDAVRVLFQSGGIRSFFAGNGLNVVKIMPETAIKFGSYEAAKRALANFEGHGDPKQINSYSKFTAGGVAGMIAQVCVYPLDTLKFRLQCETVKDGLQGSALIRQTAIKMYADGGVFAAYRGLTMGLVGMFPYSAIDMGTFELLKNTYKSYYTKWYGGHEDDNDPGNVATGIIGATSGAFGASVVYPLNVIRTRLQTQGTAMHPPTYTGIWDVTHKTIQREGYRGLYKGLTPNLLKVAPALSITWVVYENSKKFLGLN